MFQLETLVSHPVQNQLLAAINAPLCGLQVHLGVPGAGKIAYARFAALEMHAQQAGRLIEYFSAGEIPRKMKNYQLAWICSQIGISDQVTEPLTKLLPPSPIEYCKSPNVAPPISLVIDQIDHLRNFEDTESFFVGFTESSQKSKLFKFKICATSPEFVKQMLLWNGGKKIRLVGAPGCGRWDEEHVRSIVNEISLSSLWTPDRREKLITLGTKAVAPCFVIMAAAMKDAHGPALEKMAAALDEGLNEEVALLKQCNFKPALEK